MIKSSTSGKISGNMIEISAFQQPFPATGLLITNGSHIQNRKKYVVLYYNVNNRCFRKKKKWATSVSSRSGLLP